MQRDYESAGIKLSVAGSVLLALSAMVMALVAKSQAILLDGLYTFVTMVMAIVSLKVIQYGIINTQVWGLKSGRTLYLFLYCDLKDEYVTINGLDDIRRAILRKLAQVYPAFWADIQFTRINPEMSFEHIVGGSRTASAYSSSTQKKSSAMES